MCGLSLGGEPVVAPAPTPEDDWSFCDIYDFLGTPLYKNPENPLIQSFKFYGRAQFQYAYIDGDGVDGDCGKKSKAAISDFQKKTFGWKDGKVDPGGQTWEALSGQSSSTAEEVPAENALPNDQSASA